MQFSLLYDAIFLLSTMCVMNVFQFKNLFIDYIIFAVSTISKYKKNVKSNKVSFCNLLI